MGRIVLIVEEAPPHAPGAVGAMDCHVNVEDVDPHQVPLLLALAHAHAIQQLYGLKGDKTVSRSRFGKGGR